MDIEQFLKKLESRFSSNDNTAGTLDGIRYWLSELNIQSFQIRFLWALVEDKYDGKTLPSAYTVKNIWNRYYSLVAAYRYATVDDLLTRLSIIDNKTIDGERITPGEVDLLHYYETFRRAVGIIRDSDNGMSDEQKEVYIRKMKWSVDHGRKIYLSSIVAKFTSQES